MEKINSDPSCIQKFRPVFQSDLYRTTVEVNGKEITGLLLIKTMPDSSIRIVFSNEFGIKFFDFEFSGRDQFKIYSIVPQMDKKPVITTLRKDFELLLFKHTDTGNAYALRNNGEFFHGFPQESGVNYYVTDSACGSLIKMQRASSTKPVVEAKFFPDKTGSPDSVDISHKNFNFTIALKHIPKK